MVVDGVDVLGSLSPSRASDFMSCPLLFRYRTVDRLPEPASPDAVRGTVVHKVLEDLFDLPAQDRTPDRAAGLVVPAWEQILEQAPEVAEMFGEEGPELGPWLASCERSLTAYFALEDPTRLQPAERELYVETLLDSKLLLRGFVDRLDVAPTGEIRVVDYKTGKAPPEAFEAKALFQMKFYALVIWRTRGVVPRMLQLIYLGSGEVLRYSPDEHDLLATERKLEALWAAIVQAQESGDWRPNRSPMCDWCAHRAICPAWGGTPPPLPDPEPPVQQATDGLTPEDVD
ncbi:MAG: PD-(D/E)XK nuclease family protein [Nocardioidaceae bacterium]|nr:PD-(D/E)XK nuclease family protein [Nocardioidaceae bacterium]